MNIFSAFDGMSCAHIALDKAGIEVDKYYASEIDISAITIANKNYPNTIQLGNIYNIDYSGLDKVDLLLGGSPCTYWSIARGNREITSSGIGFDLFNQYIRAKNELKPTYFLYENNNSIHNDIKNEITKCLGVEPIMINSSLVSAQVRKRLYWTNIPNVKQPEDQDIILRDIIDFSVDKDIDREKNIINPVKCNIKRNKSNKIANLGRGYQGQRVYSIDGKSITLTANGGGTGHKTGLYEINSKIRRLTPNEAEQLQTVPIDYTKGVSDSQRYKMLGNGWTIDVISHLLREIRE